MIKPFRTYIGVYIFEIDLFKRSDVLFFIQNLFLFMVWNPIKRYFFLEICWYLKKWFPFSNTREQLLGCPFFCLPPHTHHQVVITRHFTNAGAFELDSKSIRLFPIEGAQNNLDWAQQGSSLQPLLVVPLVYYIRNNNNSSTYWKNSRCEKTPVQLPPSEEKWVDNFVSNHGTNIILESLVTVDPADTNAFHKTEDEEGEVSSVFVQ